MKSKALILGTFVLAASVYPQQNARPTVSLEGASVPHVVNGTLTPHALNSSLASTMSDIGRSTAGPIWAGYAIPGATLRAGERCCSTESQCRLENGDNRSTGTTTRGNVPAAFDLFLFVRFERGQPTRLRTIGSDCDIDAAGTSLQWLSGVSAADSVSYLLSLVSQDNARSFSAAAIAAISFHGAAGDPALETLVSSGQPEQTREQAAFWIASEGSPHGIDVIRKLAREDMVERFRRYLTFALTMASGDAGVQELIRMAHDDKAPSVRSQALFWMAQKAGSKVAADIASTVENDPDVAVKKQAVFALSQMRNGEGISQLIQVARTNRSAAVRKQAVFWLGQSHDPQALKFLEDVLTH
jgi:HEAT repeats